MLTEEALILLATLVASGLLALGVLELAWPSAPRRPERRVRVTSPARFPVLPVSEPLAIPDDERPIIAAEPVPFVEPSPVVEPAAEPIVEPLASVEPAAPAVEPPAPAPALADPEPVIVPEPVAEPLATRRANGTPRAPRASRTPTPRRASARPRADAAPVDPVASTPGAPGIREVMAQAEPPRPRVLPVDTCLAMYNERRFAEVVSLGSAALEVHARLAAGSTRSDDDAAALFDLVGLSKQELGDGAGARAAFHGAIRAATPAMRATYVEHLVKLVGGLLDGVGEPADVETEAERVRELRASAAALDDALAALPAAETVVPVHGAVREALSSACERLAALVAAGEGGEHARAILLEAVADDAMPAPWRERVREQLAAASSAEIGQLTAQAIRSVQDGKDGDALAALEHAEQLAAALPPGAVTDERREEFDRRLWWGYTKVGVRRVEIENYEGAIDPLFRAFHLGGVDQERLAETRGVLVRALDGLVETRAPAIQQLAAEDASAARHEIAKLSALLRAATERGLTTEELGEAFAKVAALG